MNSAGVDRRLQIQSPTSPVPQSGAPMSSGAAFSKLIASSRFDLPEPFGPIRTFRGCKSRAGESGPKDSTFFRCNRSKSMATPSSTHGERRVLADGL